jgi:methylase of polypeptide subunit release factors
LAALKISATECIGYLANIPLAPGGLVAMEIGSGQGDLLAQGLTTAGFLNAVATKDLQGRERFVFAENGAAPAFGM